MRKSLINLDQRLIFSQYQEEALRLQRANNATLERIAASLETIAKALQH